MKSTLTIVPILKKTDFSETVYSEDIKHDPEYSIVQKSVTTSKTVEEYNTSEAKTEVIKFSIIDVIKAINKFELSTVGIILLIIISSIYWLFSDSEFMQNIGIPVILLLLLIWLFFDLKKIYILNEAKKVSEARNGNEKNYEKKNKKEESKYADYHGLHGTVTTKWESIYSPPPKYRILTKYDGKLEAKMTFDEEKKENKITEFRRRCAHCFCYLLTAYEGRNCPRCGGDLSKPGKLGNNVSLFG